LWDRVKGYIKNIVITVSIVILQASRFNLRLACFILSNVAGVFAPLPVKMDLDIL